MSESSLALRDGLEVHGVRVLVGLIERPEWHARIGYLSSVGTLLTRFCRGAWPQDAAGDTQASRQAEHSAHKGILIEQSVLGSLPIRNKRKGMYKQHIRVCTQVGKTMNWGKGASGQ